MINLISILIDIFFIYILTGLVFSVWFAFFGVQKLDAGSTEAPWHFRVIIIPGCILLWLILLIKLVKKK